MLPQEVSYYYNQSLSLNYSVEDWGIGIDTVWYYITNSTNSIIISNTTLTGNTTFGVPREDTYILYLYANDSANNINHSSATFAVLTSKPAIVLNYPIGNPSWINSNNVYFNFTATYSKGLSSCQLLGNWSGGWASKYIWTNPTNNTMNYTNLSISDGFYKWNVWCKGTDATENYALNNLSFWVDAIYPNTTINSITPIAGSQTLSFVSTSTDSNLLSCKYSIFNSSNGVDGLNNNVTILCTGSKTATVSAFATYTLRVYAIDLAGNENYTDSGFTISPITPTTPGGGGEPIIFKTGQVLAVKVPENDTKLYTDLQRARMYKILFDYYGLKKEPFSIVFYDQDVRDLQQKFKDVGIDLTLEQTKAWMDNFNALELENVNVGLDDVDRYNLISAKVVVEETPFSVNPKVLDTFTLITSKNKTYEYTTTSNRVIRSAEFIEKETGLDLEITSNTTIKVKLKLVNYDFTARIIKGKINYISENGESIFQDVGIRAINLTNYKTWLYSLLVLPILITGFFVYRIAKKNGKKRGKDVKSK